MQAQARWVTPTAIVAAIFGIATLFSGGVALFGGPATRDVVGNAVPFVLWFNFLAGFAYIAGALALYLRHDLARPIAWLIGLATLAVFALFLYQAATGTPFEPRTVGAMILRSGFWLAIAAALTASYRKGA